MISNLPRSRFGLTFIKVKRHNHRIRKTYFMLRGVTLNGVLKRAWISTTVKCNCFKDAYKFCGGGLMPGEIVQETDKTFTTVLIT